MSEALPRPGDRLSDRYVIQRELGRGGAAVVYLAEDLRHGRLVAVKVLRPELAASVGDERFLREIETAARLSHPSILPLHDSGRAGSCLFYVMPCVSGDTVRDRLARERQLPIDEAVAIAREVADALAYAHGQGIVHRDVKPENVLFQAGHAVVADFGIATAVEVAAEQRLTATGYAIGTAAYMSPEQITGERVDGRSDQYSLAVVLYEMLAGQPPYQAATAHVMLARRLTEPLPALRVHRDRVPEQVDAAIRRALSPLPADRFRTVGEFAAALGASPATAGLATVPAARGRRSIARRPLAAGAAAVVLGALIGLGVLLARDNAVAGAGARIAVLPFAVGGTGALGYLGEGVVDLLARNLDGAGDLRSVDSGTVLSALGKQRGAPGIERARAVARDVGAVVFVVGSVQAIGRIVRLDAELYERDGAAPFEQARVQGDTTDLFALMDQLSGALLIKLRRDPANRMAQTAALTTQSLPALKLFAPWRRHCHSSTCRPPT